MVTTVRGYEELKVPRVGSVIVRQNDSYSSLALYIIAWPMLSVRGLKTDQDIKLSRITSLKAEKLKHTERQFII